MPDVRIEQRRHAGSVRNIEALQDGTVDIGLAQAGIAYRPTTAGCVSRGGRCETFAASPS